MEEHFYNFTPCKSQKEKGSRKNLREPLFVKKNPIVTSNPKRPKNAISSSFLINR